MTTERVTITVPNWVLDRLRERAGKERRTLSNLVAYLLEEIVSKENEGDGKY